MTLKSENISKTRLWDLWISIFAIAIIVMVPWRLWATEWTGHLDILVYLAFFAGLIGLVLGYSQFSTLIAVLFSAAYGIFCIGWLFGTTIELEITWRERILNYLGWRLRIAIQQFSAGQTVTDPILFLTVMAILLWILASAMTFILIRKGSAWPVLVPLGITLLVISHYDQNLPRNSRFLMTFIFFTLIIIGRINFLNNREKWRQEGIHITLENQADLTKTLAILAVVLVMLAWIIPITPQQMTRYSQWWKQVTEPWDRLRDRFADILVVEKVTETTITPFFDDTLRLGVGSPISREVVFTVKIDSPPHEGYRNYWRTRSYDLYDDGVWSSMPGLQDIMLFPDNFDIQFPEWEGGQAAAYTFTTKIISMGNLYVTGMPTWISRPVSATTQTLSETEVDLIALIPDPKLYAGESYRVETIVSVPTISDLRQAGVDYPDAFARYVQLPDNFSPRITALAADIATEGEHPFDITADITSYLRDNIEYSRTIPPVPAGADPIEWFLFDEQRGFCNYYATAQVLMLRALGIPSRMVVGYAEGEYDPQTQIYTVRKQDSHAWPEVYFTGYGWVPFEPTGSQEVLILPAGVERTDEGNAELERLESPILGGELDDPLTLLDDLSGEDLEDLEPLTDLPPIRFNTKIVIWVIMIAFLVMLLASVIIYQFPTLTKINVDPLPVLIEQALEKHDKNVPNWLRRWSFNARRSPAEQAYRHIGQSIRIMGAPLNLSKTPQERAQILINLLPNAEHPIRTIINQYQIDMFSLHRVSGISTRKAGRLVRRLALQARLKELFRFRKGKSPID